MLKIKNTGRFDKEYRLLVQDNPELAGLVTKQVELFVKNPKDTRIRNHKLTKSMLGKWAFGVTGDIRIVYEWQGKNVVRFLAIGGHSEVYN
ncbi:MAG: hypothetical protein A2782_01130 [Candidatus Blackburnbacteria bacterium RIFCSPHIGHO2_01_FULL_43_15b]|uniref:Type II toxin-antitoxin system mRNA interferase toxin, RelE/StbE family n=1 Tax=Candidatus Blackburnbacteria bacterium RIFCSPHIGHO2_01_FULL_43_15b TaxID=1797513 RepID=A0A1G1V1Z7_9BACT|nr:MAG: hypothetical protein A2782_01130 [Candidatus Blackburnbacteria bacterium RIFCSPHIGHO2_01_FULL_43_15b]